ncbi:MAG: 4Fe-4S dicluster domain-containing protein [Dehalococcoidales bacterium]|nr:4Fe-4S dicluster domain-containing protein [Dehalococcoidales bacterium]
MKSDKESKGSGLSRRQFIAVTAGAVGLTALASTSLVSALGQKAAAADPKAPTANKKNRRSWCMVIDLKRCDGCVTIDQPPQCTQACIQGHFVPKGQQWLEVYKVETEGKGHYFMPTPCFQCENAPCVNVCPVAATYQTPEGVVLIDHRRCIGCRLCMAACPYRRRFFNWATPELPPEAKFAEYSPEYPVPAVKGTVIKCMFCAHHLANGRLPFCVTGCPMKALYIGDLDEDVATDGNKVVKLSEFLAANDAYRYKEELGTQPRVWYLPGHGQQVGRKPDQGELKEVQWNWGGQGYDRKVGMWP